MGLRSRTMEIPVIYDFFQKAISKSENRSWLAKEVIKPYLNQRILDVGCGTATVLTNLSGCDYVGIDYNQRCIERARARFGAKHAFYCMNINDEKFKDFEKFDTVLLIGVLHHLNDDEVKQLITALPAVLKSGGTLVTCDPALLKDQHPIARLLARIDRGRYARKPEHYRTLIELGFIVQEEIFRHDLLKVPHTDAIFRAKSK